MKPRIILGLFMLSVFSCVLISDTWAGIFKKKCDYECVESSCGGSLLLDSGNEPRPEGCTKDGTDCAGNCYRNKDGTATDWCSYKKNEKCYYDSGQTAMKCGKKFKYDCGGTWASDCSCPTSGGTDTGEDGYVTPCDPDNQ